jgi:hypothetical protein
VKKMAIKDLGPSLRIEWSKMAHHKGPIPQAIDITVPHTIYPMRYYLTAAPG